MGEHREIERRFLVADPPQRSAWPVPVSSSLIEQAYLPCDEGVDRIRWRFWVDGSRSEFDRTQKQRVAEGEAIEKVTPIEDTEFIRLQRKAERPGWRTVRKRRLVFDWEGRTWELDLFRDPKGVAILEVELPSIDAPITLPTWLGELVEVTGDKRWSNESLAQVGWRDPREV